MDTRCLKLREKKK